MAGDVDHLLFDAAELDRLIRLNFAVYCVQKHVAVSLKLLCQRHRDSGADTLFSVG